MAMGLLLSKVGEAAVDWHIESAGTWAREGLPAAQMTQQVLQERGINLLNHRSRSVSKELLSSFQLILTMEAGHKEALRAEFPEIASRVYLLNEMIDRRADIHDPIGGTLADFEDTAREIDSVLTLGFEKITRLAEE